ncbi:PX domain-containing protein kinase-like protein [Anneissia japonica]|uniref:PX domain-containing protein kinase-like protein n=1 Tax=Anneissia japonica TaxID=1529436 RepID=UPI0014256EFD|nr:PX domain-containing protein kinase-like protein [Anneissia japonica]
MAVFEKKKSTRVTLDDTVPLTCLIEAAQNVQTHTDYVIRVQRGPAPENNWQINRRYSDFVTLNDCLKITGIEFPLPPKRMFGNMEREFIAERQAGLQNYLNMLLRNHMVATNFIVCKFLDPSSYPTDLHEVALQHVSMFFRSEPHWEVVEPLKDIGWRLRKSYFLVRPKDQPKVKQVLAWVSKCESKATFANLRKNLQQDELFLENKKIGLLFEILCTLRDFICKAKPKFHFLRKYCKPKSFTEFNLMNIKTYGRQILEALKFLHEKGLPYGHLHASNVMLEGNTCRLLDIENSLLGLPSYYRMYFTQFKKINTTEAIDVYCFGHLLFEMVFGEQLNGASKDNFPHTTPPSIKSVLESILNTESCKTKLPSIDELIDNPLFSDVTMPGGDRPQFRIPSKLKEPLKACKENGIEKRLKEEQKQISSYRRLSKAHAHHNSAEEKKKRKKVSMKKRMSEQTLSEDRLSPGVTSNGTTSPTSNGGSGSTSPSSAPTSPASSTTSPGSVPPPPPPALAHAPSPQTNGSTQKRGALLDSIQTFKAGALKKTETRDGSAPRV